MSSRRCLRILTLALVLAGFSGCTTTPKSSAVVHVLVSAQGMVTYFGEQFIADQLPSRLDRTAVAKSQEIRVHLEDVHNKRLMAQIYNGLQAKGYVHVLFQDAPRAVSEVVGDPDSRTETPAINNATAGQKH